MTATTHAPVLLSVVEALARTTKPAYLVAQMVYLVDWRAILTAGVQATPYEWRIDIRGPRTREIEEMVFALRAEKRPLLKRLFPTPIRALPGMTDVACDAVEHVIDTTLEMDRVELMRLVKSTYPVFTASADDANEVADLLPKARAYRKLMPA